MLIALHDSPPTERATVDPTSPREPPPAKCQHLDIARGRGGTAAALSSRVRSSLLLLLAAAALLLGGVASAAPVAPRFIAAARGHAIVEETTHRSVVHGDRRLTVILPPGYDPRSSRRYPTLYMLDGQNLLSHEHHPGGWRAAEALESVGRGHEGEPMIIVGVHAKDRMNEYTPAADPRHGGGQADTLLRYLSDELVPHIEATYRTQHGADRRALGGSSLGGLFGAHALATRPEVFSRYFINSPSVWWNRKMILAEIGAATDLTRNRVVLYNGGDSDGRKDAEELRDLLASRGLRFGVNLFHWTEPEAGHDEGAWARYMPRGLGLLFPRGEKTN